MTRSTEDTEGLAADPRFLQLLIDHMTDVVVVMDVKGTLTYVSPSVQWSLGREPDDLVGTNGLDLVHPDDRADAAAALGRSNAAAPGVLPIKHVRIARADGDYLVVQLTTYSMIDDPAINGFVMVARDVTEQTAAELGLREREERYRLLFDSTQDAVILVDAETLKIADVNPAAEELYGWSRSEFLGKRVTDVSAEPDATAEAVAQPSTKAITASRKHRRKDGSEFDVEITFGSVELDGRDMKVGVMRDVSERLRAEAEFKALIAQSSDIITVLAPDGSWRSSSDAGTRLLGYPHGFDPEGGIFSLLHPDDVDGAIAAFAGVISGERDPEETIITRVRAADDSWRYVETVARNLVDDPLVRGIVLNSRDVSERVVAEDALVESREQFRALVQNASDLISVIGYDGLFKYVSPSSFRILGYKPDELEGTDAGSFVHPDDLDAVAEAVTDSLDETKEPALVMYRTHHRDGSYRIIESLTTPLVDVAGMDGMVTNSRDVTERVAAEQALKASQARFAALIQRSTDLVTVSGTDGIMKYISPSVKEILGYTAEELVGTDAAAIMHPDDSDRVSKIVMAHVIGETDPPLLEYRVRHKDGSYRTLEGITTNLLDEPSVQGVVSNSRDVTERREVERLAGELTEILEASTEIVVLSDPTGHVVYPNQAARTMLGAYEGQDARELTSAETRTLMRDDVIPAVERHGAWSGELVLVGTHGPIPVAATVQAHRDEHGTLIRMATIAHDISSLKAAQDRLQYAALHDVLTGLPNRAMFREISEPALARATRAGESLAVLFLDLDGFKLVNDEHGHDAGDRLLIQVSQRLRDVVRLGDTLARLGGDEFVVLCQQPHSEAQMLELADRLIGVLSKPFVLGDDEVTIGASVGIAYGIHVSGTIDDMIRDADLALYRAKRAGRGRALLFDRDVSPAIDGG
jgi:diguanylate cyclase (GGDEF)-like protein/PAS domain S-box-containing protein